MKQEVNYIKQKLCNISIEEFDALDEVHEFSENIRRIKKKCLKNTVKIFINHPKENIRQQWPLLY